MRDETDIESELTPSPPEGEDRGEGARWTTRGHGDAERPRNRWRKRLCCAIVAVVAIVGLALGALWFYGFCIKLRAQSYGAYAFTVSDYVDSVGDRGAPLIKDGIATIPRARFFKDVAAAKGSDGPRFEFLPVDANKAPEGLLVFWNVDGLAGNHVGLKTPNRVVILRKSFREERSKSLRWAAENGVVVEVVVFVRKNE